MGVYVHDHWDQCRVQDKWAYEVTRIKLTPIIKRCVVMCGTKNIHSKDVRFKEIGLDAQQLLANYKENECMCNLELPIILH